MMRDFQMLGVTTVEQLATLEPKVLYDELCRQTWNSNGRLLPRCVYRSRAQARNPDLPEEQKQWWYWSRARKAKRNGVSAT